MKLKSLSILTVLLVFFLIRVYGVESKIEEYIFSLEGKTLKDISQDEIYSLLKQDGVVLLRGLDISQEDFIEFSDRFSDSFIPYIGGAIRPIVNGNPTVSILTEKDGREPVYFHGEQYYQKVRPTTFWMYCLTPPADGGGRTLLCDGRALYYHMSSQVRVLFENNKLKYSRGIPFPKWKNIYNVCSREELENCLHILGVSYQFDKDSNVALEYVDGAIHQDHWGEEPTFINSALVILEDMKDKYPQEGSIDYVAVHFENGEKIPDWALNEIKLLIEQFKIPISWEKNDFLIFDNTRVLHAREGFNKEIRREILTRFSIHEN